MKRLLWGIAVALFVMFMMYAGGAYCADEWDKTDPAGTESLSDLDTLIQANNEALDRFLRGGRRGCKVLYSSASAVTITAGDVVCSNSGGTVRHLRSNTSALTVTTADLDSGTSFTASTTHYVFAIADADATTFTEKVSTSTTPTGVTYYALIGQFTTDSSKNILAYTVQSVDADGNDLADDGDMDYKPAFMAYKTASQNITDGTATKVTFTSEEYDRGSVFSSSRFTAPYAGLYMVSSSVRLEAVPDQKPVRLYLYKNGAIYKTLLFAAQSRSTSGFFDIGGTTSCVLDSGDYLEIYIEHDAGSTLSTGSASSSVWFSGCLIDKY